MIACQSCGLVHQEIPLKAGMVATCVRCDSRLHEHSGDSLNRTAAFSLAALLLYWPANYFPILELNIYGARSENTVLDGAYRLYRDHDVTIAIIVFLASFLIPVLKLLGLFLLVISVRLKMSRGKVWRMWVFKVIDGIGRWAMLDVFAVAILISVVKLRGIGSVLPGKGLLAFSLVVLFTLLASASFDPQLIWSAPKKREKQS